MRGDYVIVRSLGDVPLVRRVWAVGERVIYVCTEERFKILKKGDSDFPLVGFPKKDVFVYDQNLLNQTDNNLIEWESLSNYDVKKELSYA